MVKQFNERIAVRATLIFGSMWMTYLFFFYGFIPVLFPKDMNTFLYWSNTVQLWSLPLIMVGQNVLDRVREKREQETHDAVMTELADLKRLHAYQTEEMAELKAIHRELHAKFEALKGGGHCERCKGHRA